MCLNIIIIYTMCTETMLHELCCLSVDKEDLHIIFNVKFLVVMAALAVFIYFYIYFNQFFTFKH